MPNSMNRIRFAHPNASNLKMLLTGYGRNYTDSGFVSRRIRTFETWRGEPFIVFGRSRNPEIETRQVFSS